MTKKITATMLAMFLVLSLTSCSLFGNNGDIPKPKISDTAIAYDDIGVAVKLPKSMEEYLGKQIFPVAFERPETKDVTVNGLIAFEYQSGAVYERLTYLNSLEKHLSPEESTELKKQMRSLMYVFSVTTESVETFERNGGKLADFSGFGTNKLVQKVGTNSIYLCYNETDISNLSPEDADLYVKFMNSISTMGITIYGYTPIKVPRSIAVGMSMKKIEATDFAKASFTKENFKDYDLTLINVWATTCPPCVSEMPELEKLHNEYKDLGLQVIGICLDTDGIKNFTAAEKIIEKTGVTYTNLVAGTYIQNNMLPSISATPTSILVDKEGKVVAKAIIGAKTHDEFKVIIDNELAKITGAPKE